MKLLFTCFLVISSFFLYEANPLNNEFTEVELRGFDPLLDLLPLYGHLKMKYIFTLKNFNLIISFIKGNPKFYADFQRELAPLGIYLPELNQLNLSVIGQNDVDIIMSIVKDTPIRDAVNEEYMKYLENWFNTHPTEKQILIDNAYEAGIVILKPDLETDEEKEALLQALGNAFSTSNILSFVPTVIKIAVYAQSSQLFGK